MSAYDVVFSNPSLDPNHPVAGSVLVNASPRDLVVALAVELTRDPKQPDARAVLKGLDSTEADQQHVISLAAPATAHRTTVVVRLAAMTDAKPRPLELEVVTQGAVCTARVLSVTPV